MVQKISIEMARVKAGMTQLDMAKALNTNRNTYADYEKYKTPMRMDKAVLFCQIVGVSIDDIIFLKENYTSSI